LCDSHTDSFPFLPHLFDIKGGIDADIKKKLGTEASGNVIALTDAGYWHPV